MTIDEKIREEKVPYDIDREPAKVWALSSIKIDKYEFLTGEEILPPDQRRLIEQAKFTYSWLGKSFEKQTKTIEEQGKTKTIEDHEKQLVESNKLLKKDFNIDRNYHVYHLTNKKIFNRLVEEKSYEFNNLKEKINPNNLVYEFKTEGRIPKGFSNYQNLIEVFINLRDGNVNPREVLKNQFEFKSHLGEIGKGNPKLKSKDQVSVIHNVQNFFDLRDKIINFFRDFSILVSEAKYKAKHGKGLKILSLMQMCGRLPIALAQVKAGNVSENLLN